MGVLHNGKEKFDNLIRRTRMKRSEQKKRPPRKSGKNKLLLQLTIPSRRGRRKKWLQSVSLIEKSNLRFKGGYCERTHWIDCQIISGQSGQGTGFPIGRGTELYHWIKGCSWRCRQDYWKTGEPCSSHQSYSRCCWNEAEKEI